MSSQLHRRSSVVVAFTAFVVLPTVPAAAAPVAAANPIAAAAPAAATSRATLTPGWLPPGYEEFNSTKEQVGAATFTTTRYTDIQDDGSAGPGIIYLQLAEGGTGVLADASEEATPVVVNDLPGVYVATELLREYRFGGSGGEVAVVGALGSVTDANLEDVVDDVVGLTELGTPDPAAFVDSNLAGADLSAVGDPGTGGGGDNSMRGTGSIRNDWSTDGANATVSKYRAHVYQGHIVAVWQAILWAEAAAMKDWFPVRQCDVDGWFGDLTEDATVWWQANVGYTANDGIVGVETWAKADSKLTVVSGQLMYRGEWDDVLFRRASTSPGRYSWYWNGAWHYTGYYTVSFTEYRC